MQITDAKVIAGRLSKVRDIMKSEGVDIYVVVTGDYHISEYAGDYFKEREFITGFTGSAGTAVITQDDARLFTDGRYFVQAEKQIEGTGFSLMMVGTPGVMNVAQYCESIVKDGMSMGFDGRTMPAEEGIELSDICKKQEQAVCMILMRLRIYMRTGQRFHTAKHFILMKSTQEKA